MNSSTPPVLYLLRRRPIVKQLSAHQFPHVSAEKFEVWRKYELLYINTYLWTRFGFFSLFFLAFLYRFCGGDIGVLLLWITAIVWHVTGKRLSKYYGRKAIAMRGKLGI